MNIRAETRLIIRRGPEYLVGKILYTTEYRWSTCPWDAWGTRSREKAEYVARKTGGDIWLWNPVAGQLRAAEWTNDAKGGGEECRTGVRTSCS